MRDELLLVKANRVNMLLDFYGLLLTEKQLTFLRLHYEEDHSLSEIAEQFGVTRQAVNDHLRRAIELLEEYERKLELLAKFMARSHAIEQIEERIQAIAKSLPEDSNQPLTSNLCSNMNLLSRELSAIVQQMKRIE